MGGLISHGQNMMIEGRVETMYIYPNKRIEWLQTVSLECVWITCH
jgi:hypothetical protein